MDAFRAIIFSDSVGETTLKKWISLGGGLSRSVGGLEILPATPALLHLMNIGAREVSGGGHLLKGGGEVYDPSCSKLGQWAL